MPIIVSNKLTDVLNNMSKGELINSSISQNKYKELVLTFYNYKYDIRKTLFKDHFKSDWLDIIEYYKSEKDIDDDIDISTDLDFRNWLIEKCKAFSTNCKRSFPIVLTDSTDNFIKEILLRTVFILDKINESFKLAFEKNLGKQIDLSSFLGKNEYITFPAELTVSTDIKDEIIHYFRYFDMWFTEYYDDADVCLGKYFKTLTMEDMRYDSKLPYFSSSGDVCESLVDRTINYDKTIDLDDSVSCQTLKESIIIFHTMNESPDYKYSEICGLLLKVLIMYYGIKEIIMNNKRDNIDFLCDYFEHCIKNVEYEPDEHNKLIVDMSRYKLSYMLLRSTEAPMDAGMDFGASALKKDNLYANNFARDNFEDKYTKKFSKLKNTWNDIRVVKPSKLKTKINSIYFKKWYGRIPSMFAKYGSEATVTENKMRGDPTLILANSAPKYIVNIITETNKLFQSIIDLSKRISSTSDISGKLNAVKSWCTTYKIEDLTDPKSVEKSIKNEITLRIAKCIFQNNDVYGYSAEGIVENGKFPSANHIVTSLFIENSNEEPQQQSVADIFSKPESITVYAHPEKIASFDELYKKTSDAIVNNFSQKMVSGVHQNLEVNYRNYANSLRRKSSEIDGGDANDAENNKKLAKAIENGLVNGLELAIDQKSRCMECIGAMYDMVTRVQKLAKLCVAALHEAEVKHGDTRMNTGINNKLRNSTNARLNKINEQNNGERYTKIKPPSYL